MRLRAVPFSCAARIRVRVRFDKHVQLAFRENGDPIIISGVSSVGVADTCLQKRQEAASRSLRLGSANAAKLQADLEHV